MRSVLGSLGPFQDISWHARQFLPVGVWAGPIISILLWWKIFDGRPSPNHYQSVKWSLRCILGHFKQNQRRCFFKKWPFVHSFFWLFLPHFAIYGRFWTLNIKSGLIPSLWMQKGQQNHKKWNQKLIWNFGCSTYPKSHPGVKIDPKMAGGGQNWPRCTPCGPTNLFRAKKTNFETARSKPHFFTRNDPYCL